MANNRDYLIPATGLLLTTAVLLAASMVMAAMALTSVAVGIDYLVCIAIGLACLIASLVLGCQDLVRGIALLGCEDWSVRRMMRPLAVRLVLVCLGTFFMALSLFLVQ
jgi:hypothetical protein